MRSVTDYLFARPSFLEGLARLFDFRGTLNEYNTSSTTTDADVQALEMDMAVIGDDFRQALGLVQQEIDTSGKAENTE